MVQPFLQGLLMCPTERPHYTYNNRPHLALVSSAATCSTKTDAKVVHVISAQVHMHNANANGELNIYKLDQGRRQSGRI